MEFDATLFSGLIGALIGAGIGLLGQRMSIREQRRKEWVQRTADLLLLTDQFVGEAANFSARRRRAGDDEVSMWLSQLTSSCQAISRQRLYLEMTAPFRLRFLVRPIEAGAQAVYQISASMDYTGSLEAAHEEARTTVVRAQHALLAHARKGMHDVPWRDRKPWLLVRKVVRLPFVRRTKEASMEADSE